MVLYTLNSTCLGSTMISRTCSGVVRYSRLHTMALMHTDLPLPVAPAMSRWGILLKSHSTGDPAMSLPSATSRGEGLAFISGLSSTSRRDTVLTRVLGTSMPI